MKDEKYFFHQSPMQLCKDIIDNIRFKPDDILFEPFAGENSFYDQFPEGITKHRCEIENGLDFHDFDYDGIKPTMIITNPPFRLENKNAFNYILNYFAKKTSIENLHILCNLSCWNSLTPKRMMELNENGLFINKVTTVNVKKWFGRYFIIHFSRTYNPSFDYLISLY